MQVNLYISITAMDSWKFISVAIWILSLLGVASFTEAVRTCYRCLVQEGCLTLDVYGNNVTKECVKGVEHCVISRTESKVTGAVAKDHMCGGLVYDVEDPSLKDGCFQSIDDPEARTQQTVCYCSYDLCNKGSNLLAGFGSLLIPLVFYVSYR